MMRLRRMFRFSNRWKTALLLFPILGTFSGCARAPDDRTSDGRVIVSYWEKWTGFEADAMRVVVDDFNRAQTNIEVRMLNVSPIDQKFLLATAGGNPPDLCGLWSHSIPDLSEKGALTPLDSALPTVGVASNEFNPLFWNLCRHRGFTWGVPTLPACLALHYNRALFREAGLDPDQPPRTMAELEAMSQRLTKVELIRDGRKVTVRYNELTEAERKARAFTLVQAGHLPQEPGWWLPLWGYWFGGDLFDGDRRVTADASANRAAFAWLEETSNRYGVENLRAFGSSFGNFASAQNAFLSGRVAMILQGVWMHNFIEKYAPTLDWSAAPFPSAVTNAAPVTLVECDLLVIPKGARHPREALQFMRYVTTRGPAEKLALGQRKFTALRDVSADFLSRHPNPHIGTFLELSRSAGAKPVPRLSIWREYEQELRVASERVLYGMASPDAAIAEVQQRAQWRYDRVLRRWDRVADERAKEWREADDAW